HRYRRRKGGHDPGDGGWHGRVQERCSSSRRRGRTTTCGLCPRYKTVRWARRRCSSGGRTVFPGAANAYIDSLANAIRDSPSYDAVTSPWDLVEHAAERATALLQAAMH